MEYGEGVRRSENDKRQRIPRILIFPVDASSCEDEESKKNGSSAKAMQVEATSDALRVETGVDHHMSLGTDLELDSFAERRVERRLDVRRQASVEPDGGDVPGRELVAGCRSIRQVGRQRGASGGVELVLAEAVEIDEALECSVDAGEERIRRDGELR